MVILCFGKKHHFFHGFTFLWKFQVLTFRRMADYEKQKWFFFF